jgi:hypothetical protein
VRDRDRLVEAPNAMPPFGWHEQQIATFDHALVRRCLIV